MIHNTNLDDLLRGLDPLGEELDRVNAGRRDAVWAQVVAQEAPARPRIRHRGLIGDGSVATLSTTTRRRR